jgi:hypothetical protein
MHLSRTRRCFTPPGTLAILLVLAASPAGGAEPKPTEYEVKAIYLYNFARFVEWPAGAPEREGGRDAERFTICVLGRDPFGQVLDRVLAGETLHGRRAAAKRISGAREASGCELVFISESERGGLGETLRLLREKSILTVSDMDDFSTSGGMIQLVLEDERVRFEVNLAAATKAGLRLSSELLKVARAVRRDSSVLRRGPVPDGPQSSGGTHRMTGAGLHGG